MYCVLVLWCLQLYLTAAYLPALHVRQADELVSHNLKHSFFLFCDIISWIVLLPRLSKRLLRRPI